MRQLSLHIKLLFAAFMCVSPMYAQTGWQWVTGSLYATGPNPGLGVVGAALDDSGNVVVAGYAGSPGGLGYVDHVVYGPDMLHNTCGCSQHVVVKTDSNGHIRWARGAEHGGAKPYGIGADRQGNIYVFGRYDSSTISFDTVTLLNPALSTYYLVKYSPGGSVLWARNVIASNRLLQVGTIGIGEAGVDGGDNIYVSGTMDAPSATIDGITLINTSPTGDTNDVFIAKFNSAGGAVWAKSFGGKFTEIPYAMAVAPSGNVYLTGYFRSDTMWVDGHTLPDSVGALMTPFFVKFDKTGHAVWVKRYHAALEVNAMTTDAVEHIYVTGTLKGDVVLGTDTLDNIGTFNTYVAKYDRDGNIMWARCAGSLNMDYGWSIAVDSCDRVLVSGLSYGTQYGTFGTMNFEGDVLPMPVPNWDPTFVAQYSTSGEYISSIAFASGAFKEFIVADKRGSYYLAGSYARAPMDFGAYSLPTPASISNAELFVAKNWYDSIGCFHPPPPPTLRADQVQQTSSYTLVPNPATGSCVIKSNGTMQAGTRAYVYDISGREVLSAVLQNNETSVSLKGLVQGMYYCRIVNSAESSTTLKLVVLE